MAETEHCYPISSSFRALFPSAHVNLIHLVYCGQETKCHSIITQSMTLSSPYHIHNKAGAVEKHFRRNTKSRFVETTIALPHITTQPPKSRTLKTTLKVPLPLLSWEPKVTAFVIDKKYSVSDLEGSLHYEGRSPACQGNPTARYHQVLCGR